MSNGDVSHAIERAFDHCAEMAKRAIQEAAWAYQRPSVMLKPRIFIDGNKWCCLYGENLQEGVAGFGDSPALAANDFDTAWETKITSSPAEEPR